MEDACDHLHAFQEYEHYSLVVNSVSDCDVPEDELTDEMEDTSSDENQLTPVCLEGPTEGDHGQQSPGDIRAVGETIAIEWFPALIRRWRTAMNFFMRPSMVIPLI